MPSVPQQLFLRSRATEVSMPIDLTVAAGAINSGDMVYWTGTGAASLSTAGAANANAANFLGVSRDTFPFPVAAGITEGAIAGFISAITVTVEGEFQFKTTNAQTFAPFASVYLGADGQTVSTTVSGTAIGTVAPDQRTVGGTLGGSIVGTGTNYVAIRIKPALT